MFGRKRRDGCEPIRDMLSPYLDGRLSEVERDVVRYHIDLCAGCRHELRTLEATTRLLRRLPSVAAPRSFTLAEAPARRKAFSFAVPESSWMKVATAAAAIVLIAMVAVDLSGALDTTPNGVTAEAPSVSVPESTAILPDGTGDVLAATPEAGSVESHDATLPEPSPGPYTATDASNDGPSQVDDGSGAVSPFPEATQQVDPGDGGGKVTSPAPSPSSPSWVLVLEIVSGALVVALGGFSLLGWRQRRVGIRP